MLQRFVILVLVGGKTVLAQNKFGQVKRETIGIFEREHIHTADLRLTGFACLVHQFVEQTDTLVQCTEESLFLGLDDRHNLVLLFNQFGVCLTHVSNQLRHKLVEESRTHVKESISITNRTSQDTTDDISRFLVRRQLAVRDSERDRTDMVRNHTHRNVGLLVLAVFATADSADLGEHRLEHIGVVVGRLALDRTHQTLEAHSGIDHFLSQRFETAVCLAVVLHEHDVPDLDHLRMIFVHELSSTNLSPFVLWSAVHMDL